jgi:phosphate transport system permease protein
VATETPTPAPGPKLKPQINRSLQRVREKIIEYVLLGCGLLSIIVTFGIAAVVLTGSAEFFLYKDVPVAAKQAAGGGAPPASRKGGPVVVPAAAAEDPAAPAHVQLELMSAGEIWDRAVYFFTGTDWTTGFENPRYGILPLVIGTLMVTVIAAAIAMPIGLSTAIYLSEYARPRVRAFAKPTLELLAGIPTVVYGFFAITAITPFLGVFFEGNIGDYDNGLVNALWNLGLLPLFPGTLGDPNNQIAAGIVVGIMIIPMVASLSEDALRAVPRSLRDGAIALGANKFETSVKVVLPAALSGVMASFILALSRAIGETMAVSLAAGETARFTFDPREGLATMTSFIVSRARGEVEVGSTDYNSIFAVAGLLFFMTLLMNVLAQVFLRRYRQVYQ